MTIKNNNKILLKKKNIVYNINIIAVFLNTI